MVLSIDLTIDIIVISDIIMAKNIKYIVRYQLLWPDYDKYIIYIENRESYVYSQKEDKVPIKLRDAIKDITFYSVNIINIE